MHREATFLVSVMLLGVAGVVLTKILAASEAGAHVPGLRPLAAML